jgi:hypothetical protein
MQAWGFKVIEVKRAKDPCQNYEYHIEEVFCPLCVIVDARVWIPENEGHLMFLHEVRDVRDIEASNYQHQE